MVLAEFSFGDVLLSILFFFFLMMWIMIILNVIMDLFRDTEESGAMKVVWVLCILFFTPIAVLIYLIVKGRGMAERQIKQQARSQQQYAEYVQSVAGTSATDQIASAKSLLDSGAISQTEFDTLKAKALAS